MSSFHWQYLYKVTSEIFLMNNIQHKALHTVNIQELFVIESIEKACENELGGTIRNPGY